MDPSNHIDALVTGLMDHTEIMKLSVCEITETGLHNRGRPLEGSVLDVKLGATTTGACGTCLKPQPDCTGHFGHYCMPYPVPGIGTLGKCLKTLNISCFVCFRLLMTEKNLLKLFGDEDGDTIEGWFFSKTYTEISTVRKRKYGCICPHCGMLQPQFIDEQPFIVPKWPEDKELKGKLANARDAGLTTITDEEFFEIRKMTYTNWWAYHTLKGISDKEQRLIGIDPDVTKITGMMYRVLVIPSTVIRPVVATEDGTNNIHHLSRKLIEIMKTGKAVTQAADASKYDLQNPFPTKQPPDKVKEVLRQHYDAITNYQESGKAKIPNLKVSVFSKKKNGRSATSLADAMKGKKGLYRGNAQSKRVNFSARTVIIPGADLDIDEVGVPEKMAKKLTEPFTITATNRKAIRQAVIDGKIKQIIDPRTGTIIATAPEILPRKEREQVLLINGWTAERYLQNGSIVAFNRQPTLHKLSMMGHRVRILPGILGMAMHSAITGPYNADHDGDEMNFHVPQTDDARTELKHLMSVTRGTNMLHPRAHTSAVGFIQDGLIGVWFLTRDTMRLTRDEMSYLLGVIEYDPDTPNHIPMGDDRSRIGVPRMPKPAYPDGMYSGRQAVSVCLPSAVTMEIPGGGSIVNGELISGTLGKAAMGSSTNGIIHHLLIYYGGAVAARFISDLQRVVNRYTFWIGFSIGLNDTTVPEELSQKSQFVIKECYAFINEVRNTAKLLGTNDQRLKDAVEGKVCEALRKLLTFVSTLLGNEIDRTNAMQLMTNVVGSKGKLFNMFQSMICVGQTIENSIRPTSDKPTVRGLSNEPFVRDQSDLGAFGFVERPFKRGLRARDSFTNNTGGREGIIDTALKTSDTGYIEHRAQRAMEGVRVTEDYRVRDLDGSIVQQRFGNDGMEPAKLVPVKMPELLLDNMQMAAKGYGDEILRLRDVGRRGKITVFRGDLRLMTTTPLAFDAHVVRNMVPGCSCCGVQGDVDYYDSTLNELCDEMKKLTLDGANYSSLHLRVAFHEKRGYWCCTCVNDACDRIYYLFKGALVVPGEAVGGLCATSFGEPATQMTLNTFHFSSTGLVTLQGIPRLKEAIGATSNIATPITTIQYKGDVKALTKQLPELWLRDLITDASVIREPNVTTTVVLEDAEMVLQHAPFLKHYKLGCDVIRFELCKDSARRRGLTPQSVSDVLRKVVDQVCLVASSLTSADTWAIRLYIHNVDIKTLLEKWKPKGRRRLRGGAETYTHETCNEKDDQATPIYSHRISSKQQQQARVTVADKIRWRGARGLMDHLMGTVFLAGVPGVEAVAARTADITHFCPDTGKVTAEEINLVDVRGTAFDSLLTIPGVVLDNVASNNIMAVFRNCGIVAAQHTVFFELQRCMEDAGTNVDPHLAKMFADIITRSGQVIALSRGGIAKQKNRSALGKICFEEPINNLNDTAFMGNHDPLRGVSERIACGLMVNMGTEYGRSVEKRLHPNIREMDRISDTVDSARIGGTKDAAVVTSYCEEAVIAATLMGAERFLPVLDRIEAEEEMSSWDNLQQQENDEAESNPFAMTPINNNTTGNKLTVFRVSSPVFGMTSTKPQMFFRVSSPPYLP
jgi:DNA-directed RNA polymerase II subunit RPB1